MIRCASCQTENSNAEDTCHTCGQSLTSKTGPLKLGALVGGRYEVQALLGQGGMGVVYKAYDRLLEEVVALKVLRAEVATPELTRRFRDEIRMARRVSHRNVCRIHEYGEDGPLSYISMAFVDGVDLKHILRDKGPLPPATALEIAEDVAAGLQAIHDEGIVHRDLKTANLMRDQRGVVRLMDFGIAKDRSAGTSAGVTSMGVILGTPDYMSPEQASGARLDARSDVYALGIVVYELFTGRVPFRGDTPMATLLAHVREPLRLDTAEAGAIPPAVRPILTRALAKSPDERFATAREMGEALATARRGARLETATPVPGPTLTPLVAPTQAIEATAASALTKGPTPTRTMVGAGAPAPGTAPTAPTRPRPSRSLSPLLWLLAGVALVLAIAAAVLLVSHFGSGTKTATVEVTPTTSLASIAPPATTTLASAPTTRPSEPPITMAPSTTLAVPVTTLAGRPLEDKPPRRTAASAAPSAQPLVTAPVAPATPLPAATDAAWNDARALAEDAARPEHERIAALRKYISESQASSPHRADAERLLSKLQQDARARLLAAPDPASLGRPHRALYAGGTLSVAEGSEGNIAFPDRERMLFMMAGSRFLVVPFRGVSGIEYGLTSRIRGLVFKKKSHYVSINYEDVQGEAQGLVLELGQDDFRAVLTMLEARTGRKIEYQDAEAAKNRWK